MPEAPITAEAAIAELDATLAMFRKSWLEAKPDEKAKWWRLINKALDEHIALMALR